MERLLKPQEVADLLGVKLNTVYQWTCFKKIPFIKLPGSGVRFSKRSLEKYFTEKEEQPWTPIKRLRKRVPRASKGLPENQKEIDALINFAIKSSSARP